MAKQELASQIIKFIAKEAQAAPEKAESLQVVSDMLADAFGVQVASAAASGSELEGALAAIAARVAKQAATEDVLEKGTQNHSLFNFVFCKFNIFCFCFLLCLISYICFVHNAL